MSKDQFIFKFIKNQFKGFDKVPLHEPKFIGNEKKYILDAIESSYVSSSGFYVDKFENDAAKYLKVNKAVSVVNGTSALHTALKLVGVSNGDEVITQALTFIATANAISYNGAKPIFLDVDLDTMGLSPQAVDNFLGEFGELREDGCYNKKTKKKISACIPMHTFGFPVQIDRLERICSKWKIPIVEDAAEAIGSKFNSKYVGCFGDIGVYSLNGNKIITSGGGGLLVSKNKQLMNEAKHIVTTAKVPHEYEYLHDKIGFNYRMPNINAALACAQLENLELFIENKRKLAEQYFEFFSTLGIKFRKELKNTRANYWLMCIEFNDKVERNNFLKKSNLNNIITRPIWRLMIKNNPYSSCQKDSLKNSYFLENRIVNIPSSARI